MSSAICVFFFNDTAPTEIYTLSLHDALPIYVAAFVAAYILLTYLHVVLGEQAPKALALRRAEDVALFVTGPLLAFGRATRPFIRVIAGSSRWIVNLLRLPRQSPEKEVHSLQELGMLVEESEETGLIPT